MRYEAPESIKAAATMLAKEKGAAFVLAGGTDLLVKMKGGFLEPDLVVDIKRIKGMYDIKKSATGFRIGAAVPGVALGEHAALVKAWPGVVEAANLIGSKQVQGRCTMVGNMCNASPAADSVPALIAAGAKIAIVGPKGKRTIAVEQVAVSPGRTSLKKGEIVEASRNDALTNGVRASICGAAYIAGCIFLLPSFCYNATRFRYLLTANATRLATPATRTSMF